MPHVLNGARPPMHPHFTTSACVEVLAVTLKLVGSFRIRRTPRLFLQASKCTGIVGKGGDTLQTSIALSYLSIETRRNLPSLSFIMRSESSSQVLWLINLSMDAPLSLSL